MRQKTVETFKINKTDNGWSIVSDDGLTDLEVDETLTKVWIKRNKLKRGKKGNGIEGEYTKTTLQEILHAVKYNGEIWKVDHIHVYKPGYSWSKTNYPPVLTYHLRNFGRTLAVSEEELFKGDTA